MSDLNLHQKLVEVRKNIDGFTKDAKSYNYSYVSGSQVLSKIQDKMNELNVLLIPSVENQSFETFDYKDKKGNEKTDFIVHGSMTYTWSNADDPSDEIVIPFYYTGQQDDISKAFGSGLTYSERYFLLKFFNLPTDEEDPDKRDTTGKAKSYSSGKATPKQLDFVDKLLKGKVTKEYTFKTLHDGLKKRLKTDENMENWTSQQASQAINMLQVDKK